MRVNVCMAFFIFWVDFPSFSEGLSLRACPCLVVSYDCGGKFPFLFGGTFIEGPGRDLWLRCAPYFPSFSEGLSLRGRSRTRPLNQSRPYFPSFSEGLSLRDPLQPL